MKKLGIIALMSLLTAQTAFATTCSVYPQFSESNTLHTQHYPYVEAEPVLFDKGIDIASSKETADVVVTFRISYTSEGHGYNVTGSCASLYCTIVNKTKVEMLVEKSAGERFQRVLQVEKTKKASDSAVGSWFLTGGRPNPSWPESDPMMLDLLKSNISKIKKLKCHQ